MKITRITRNNEEAFESVMPDYYPGDESLLLLGAVADDGTGCAALAADIYGHTLNIDRLYTHPDYREEGAADELFKTLLSLVNDINTQTADNPDAGSDGEVPDIPIDCIEITFTDDDENMDNFLMDHDFLIEEDEGVFRVPLSDILYSSRMYDLLDEVSLSGLSVKAVNPDLMDPLREYITGKGDDPDILEGISDRLSVVGLDKDNNVTGCLITRDLGDKDIEVMAFYNDGSVSGISELTAAMYVLTKEDYEDHNLVFTDREGNAMHYVSTMTGEDTEDYRVKGIFRGVRLIGQDRRGA